MKRSYEFPRVTTRGHFDLNTGDEFEKRHEYSLYPSKKVKKITRTAKELVIFVHGMRNTKWGAQNGGKILRRRLRKIGYKKHPVIVFSYDADVRRAHLLDKPHDVRLYHEILDTATKIAKGNARKLERFIKDVEEINPNIKIHLVGHSLGCNILEHVNWYVNSIHLFGSPVESNIVKYMGVHADNVINYFNPKDDVIKEGVIKGHCKKPSCLNRVENVKVKSKKCNALHHGFSAYAEKLRKFP